MNGSSLFWRHVRRCLVVLPGLGVILALASSTVSARARRVPFSGPSSFSAPESEPERQWVSEDNVMHIRGLTQVCTDEFSDPRISGTETVTINANLRLSEDVWPTGPVWGTSIIENDQGYWNMVWTGTVELDGSMTVHGVLHGHGAYEGLHAEYLGYRPDGQATVLDVSGEILETGVYDR